MQTSVNPCSAVLAVAGAGILSLSLVTAPSSVGVVASRNEVHAVQLAAITASSISNVVLDTAADLTSAVALSSQAPAAAARSSADSTASTSAAATASVTPADIATGVIGILADVAVGVVLLAIDVPLWYLLAPVTFTLTGLVTVIGGCSAATCFTSAATNFVVFPFIAPALALQQAASVATALFQQIFAPITSLTGAAAAKSASSTAAAAIPDTSGTAAAATPDTADAGAVAASPADDAVNSKGVAGLRTRASAASGVKPNSADASVIDNGDSTPAPSASAVSDGNSSPAAPAAKAPGSGKSGRKGVTHSSTAGSARSSKGQ
jgi:hypothetical protein